MPPFYCFWTPGFSVGVRGNYGDSTREEREVIAAVRAGSTVCCGYTVREIHFGKAAMREYIAPSGVVFGVDWEGMVQPDITRLLGSFADAYLEDLLQGPGEPKNLGVKIETEDIVVQKWRPPGDVCGRAMSPT